MPSTPSRLSSPDAAETSQLVANCADLVLSAALPGDLTVTALTREVAQLEGLEEGATASRSVRPQLASLAAQGAGAEASAREPLGVPATAGAAGLKQEQVVVQTVAGDGKPPRRVLALSRRLRAARRRLHHYALGLGGKGQATFTLITIGLEVGIVEAGVWVVSIFASRTELGLPTNRDLALGTYGVLLLAEVAISYLRNAAQGCGAHAAARRQQRDLIKSVMRADASYFDATPLGALLQLFAGDLAAVTDATNVQKVSNTLAYCVAYHCAIVVSCCVSIPVLTLPTGLVLLAELLLLGRFHRTHAEAAALCDQQVSLFRAFTELLTGLPTIRGFQSTPALLTAFFRQLDADAAGIARTRRNARHHFFLVELIGGGFYAACALACALGRGRGVGGDQGGFVVLNAAFLTGLLFTLISVDLDLADLAAHRDRLRATAPPPPATATATPASERTARLPPPSQAGEGKPSEGFGGRIELQGATLGYGEAGPPTRGSPSPASRTLSPNRRRDPLKP